MVQAKIENALTELQASFFIAFFPFQWNHLQCKLLPKGDMISTKDQRRHYKRIQTGWYGELLLKLLCHDKIYETSPGWQHLLICEEETENKLW
jgi:hypothetical protein